MTINYDKAEERADIQRQEIEEKLNSKDYLVTLYQTGEYVMSNGDQERMVAPRRTYGACSLNEISDYIKMMRRPWWQHPDLKEDYSNEDAIPFEEKQWGIYYNLVVEPMSAELEKRYIEASKESM